MCCFGPAIVLILKVFVSDKDKHISMNSRIRLVTVFLDEKSGP